MNEGRLGQNPSKARSRNKNERCPLSIAKVFFFNKITIILSPNCNVNSGNFCATKGHVPQVYGILSLNFLS